MSTSLAQWPTIQELGGYYFTFTKMLDSYARLLLIFEEEHWFMDLETQAYSVAFNEEQGTYDMLTFAETFYHHLPYYNWDVYMIVRPFFHSFR